MTSEQQVIKMNPATTIVSNIACSKCDTPLSPHTMDEHLDPTHPIHCCENLHYRKPKKFIYRCSWFKTKRHTKSHTTMCFEKAEHTKWIFCSDDWFHELVKIEYIMVDVDQEYYKSAVRNSAIAEKKD
jgi:hypothetical protein